MMFNLILLTLAALVIAVLYGRVKAWDEQHEVLSAAGCQEPDFREQPKAA